MNGMRLQLLLVALVTTLTLIEVSSAQDSKEWGTVKGRVVLDGKKPIPEPRPIDATKIPESEKVWTLSKGPIYYEDWVINKKNRGIKNVFVWLIPDSAEKSAKLNVHADLKTPKNKTVVIEQPPHGYSPHAIAMLEGQELMVKNDSPITHSFIWQGNPNKSTGNRNMPSKTSFTLTDLKADRIPYRITCGPHPWELAWIRVFDHPYFAVTNADGDFEIKLAPAGKCRLVVWHEEVGFLGGAKGKSGREITIPGGGAVDAGNLELSGPDQK